MGVQGGVENLPWLSSATFLAMLFTVLVLGFAAARLPRGGWCRKEASRQIEP